jgi:hypothetical protein
MNENPLYGDDQLASHLLTHIQEVSNEVRSLCLALERLTERLHSLQLWLLAWQQSVSLQENQDKS